MRRVLLVGLLLVAVVVGGCGIGKLPANTYHATHHHHRHRLSALAWCGYHAWRLAHDAQHGHVGWSAWHAWRAAHHCRRAA